MGRAALTVSTPRKRSVALGLAAIVAGISVFTAMSVFRAKSESTSDKICDVLYRTVASSGATVGKRGTPGYAYYQAHPDELAAARAQNHRFLDDLPCGPHTTR